MEVDKERKLLIGLLISKCCMGEFCVLECHTVELWTRKVSGLSEHSKTRLLTKANTAAYLL